MQKLRFIEVEGIVTFKGRERLELDAPITVIRGQNRDRRSKGSANAVGKSLIMSMLPTIRYATPPSAAKKNSAKTVYGKKSRAAIGFDRGKHSYEIVQASHGASLKLAVIKNGKDLGYRESGEARKLLERLIPISLDKFYTLYYLDTFRPSQILKASTSARFDLFEKLFDIDAYDTIYKVVSKRYNELKLKLQKADTLKEQLEELESASDKKLNIKKAIARKQKLSKLTTKYSRRVERLYDEKNHLSAYISVFKDDNSAFTNEEILEAIIKNKNKLKEAKEARDKAVEYWAAWRAQAEAQNQLEILQTKLKAYKDEKPYNKELHKETINQLNVTHDKYARKKQVLAEHIASLEQTKVEPISDKLKKFIKAIKANPKAIEEGRASLNVYTERLRQFVKLEKHAGENHKCPTCTQKISAKFVADNIAEETAKVERYTKAIKNLMAAKEYLDNRKAYNEIEAVVADMKAEVALLKDEGKKLQKREEIMQREKAKHEIQHSISLLPIGKLGKAQPKPETFDEQIESRTKKLEKLRELQKIRERAAELEKTYESVEWATKARIDIDAEIQTIAPKLKKYNEELQQLVGKIEKAKLIREQRAKLESNITEEQKHAADFDIYSSLREAYGAKGMRLIQLDNMAGDYIKSMNAMAHLIFPERITFDYRIAKGVFEILATRSGETSDIRFLSGSESRAFMLLSVLALLPFVPKSDRLDTLVCDEIESGMDKPTQRLFTEEFLPVLNKLIPKIVIITPQSRKDFHIPNSKEVVVVKHKGVSTLN